MKKYKLILMMTTVLMIALVACGGAEDAEVASSNPALLATAEPLPSATATVTVAVVDGGGATVVETAAAMPTTAPTASPMPTATSEPELEGSDPDCLLGTWRVTNFEAYLLETMMQSVPEGTDIDFEVGGASGYLALTFTEDQMQMTSENFVLRMTVAGQPVETAVTADGISNYVADETTITGTATEYDSTGVEMNTGQSITLNVADLTAAGADGPGTVNYTCAGDAMVWSGPFSTPIEMVRID